MQLISQRLSVRFIFIEIEVLHFSFCLFWKGLHENGKMTGQMTKVKEMWKGHIVKVAADGRDATLAATTGEGHAVVGQRN